MLFQVPLWPLEWVGSTRRMNTMFSFSESMAITLSPTARVCWLEKFPPIFFFGQKKFISKKWIWQKVKILSLKNHEKMWFWLLQAFNVLTNVSKHSKMSPISFCKSLEHITKSFRGFKSLIIDFLVKNCITRLNKQCCRMLYPRYIFQKLTFSHFSSLVARFKRRMIII